MREYPFCRYNSWWGIVVVLLPLELVLAIGLLITGVYRDNLFLSVFIWICSSVSLIGFIRYCCYPAFYSNSFEVRYRYFRALNMTKDYSEISYAEIECLRGSRGPLFCLHLFFQDGTRSRKLCFGCMPDRLLPDFVEELRRHGVKVVIDKAFYPELLSDDVPAARKKLGAEYGCAYATFMLFSGLLFSCPIILFAFSYIISGFVTLLLAFSLFFWIGSKFSYPVIYTDGLEIHRPCWINTNISFSDIASACQERKKILIFFRDGKTKRLPLGLLFEESRMSELRDAFISHGIDF